MADRRFELTYGTETRAFTIPEDKLAGPLIAPRKTEPLPGEVPDVLRKALAEPLGRPRLRELAEDKDIAIVISDEFRSGLQREILNALIEEVVPGVPASITVFCATGTHAPAVYAKSAAGWVEEARERHDIEIDYEPHDSERSEFADLGVTSRGTRVRVNSKLLACNLRVYGHESKPHYFYGYSCVDKQVLPGLCSGGTVEQNHKWALDPGSGPARSHWHPDPARRGNPVSQDGHEARALTERFVLSPGGKAVRGEVITFSLDMVSGPGKVFWVRAGDPDAVSREMIGVVDRMMAFQVQRARYVVISPGGPPASQALYGTQNSFDLALRGAILPGGEALVVAPLNGRPDLPSEVCGLAPDLRPKKLFWDNLVRLRHLPLEEARKEIADNFELYLWKTDRVLRLLNGDKIKIHLHSQLSEETLAPGGFFVATDIQAWIDERVQRGDGQFTVIDHGNKLCVTSAG